MTFVAIVCLVFAAALAAAVYVLSRALGRLQRLEQDLALLARDLDAANEEVSQLLAEVSGSRIIVEIVNPMTLARARSKWGAALIGVAPGLVRRRVYETVARQMKRQLAENDVEARLQIFHPTGP